MLNLAKIQLRYHTSNQNKTARNIVPTFERAVLFYVGKSKLPRKEQRNMQQNFLTKSIIAKRT